MEFLTKSVDLGGRFKKKMVVLKSHKNFLGERLALKATYFTQNFNYLNPKGELFSCNIDPFMATYISKQKWAWQG